MWVSDRTKTFKIDKNSAHYAYMAKLILKDGGSSRNRLSARSGSATPPPSHPEMLSSHHARKPTFSRHAFLPSIPAGATTFLKSSPKLLLDAPSLNLNPQIEEL